VCGVRPCALVAIGIESGDTPEVRAGIEISEVEALDWRASTGNPGLVDELFLPQSLDTAADSG